MEVKEGKQDLVDAAYLRSGSSVEGRIGSGGRGGMGVGVGLAWQLDAVRRLISACVLCPQHQLLCQ